MVATDVPNGQFHPIRGAQWHGRWGHRALPFHEANYTDTTLGGSVVCLQRHETLWLLSAKIKRDVFQSGLPE